MKRLLRYLNRLLPLSAIGLFLLSIVYLILVIAFGQGNERIIYWLAYFPPSFEQEAATSFIILAPVGLALIIGIRILSRRSPNMERKTRFIQDAILLILFANLCLFGTTFVRAWQTGPFNVREHIETVQTADHVYHLLIYSGDPVEAYNDRYLLYECDSLDFMCQEVYSVFHTTIYQETNEVSLGTDSKSNRIGLLVNGEIVYISQPE